MLLAKSSLVAAAVRHLMKPALLLNAAVAAISLAALVCPAAAQTSYSGGSISVQNTLGSSAAIGSGSSTATVSGAPGTVATVSVALNGLTSAGPRSGSAPQSTGNDSVFWTSFVLQSPGGQKFVLLGCTGDGIDGDDQEDSGNGLSNVTVNVSDANSTAAPDGLPWQHTGTANVKPSSYWKNGSGCQLTALPPDISGDTVPQTDGSATLNGTFANAGADGAWTLSILTYDTFDPTTAYDPISISGWTLTLTFTATQAASTTTSLSSNANPDLSTANTVIFTATVSSTSTVNAGTVTFSTGGNNFPGCGAVAVSNGQAQCAVAASSLGQGIFAINAAYNGTASFSSSSGSMNELIEGASTQSGDTWCNPGTITLSGEGQAQPYPSVIHVSGYGAGETVSTVKVELLDATGNLDAQHLLVAPTNSFNLDFFDNGFNAADSASSPIALNFFDSAGQYPNNNNAPAGGNYEASDENNSGNGDAFPSSSAPGIDTSIPQVPGTINRGYNPFAPYPTSGGPVTNTFENEFNGAPANGDWALYISQNIAATETIAGGWCVALTLNTGVTTTTAVTSNANPQVAQSPVTLTATVKAGGTPVTSGGTVTFLENGGLPAGITSPNNVVALNTANGQASLTTGAVSSSIDIGAPNQIGPDHFLTIYEGDYLMAGDYSGDADDNPSTGNLEQRFDGTTSFSAGGSIRACNTGAVLLNNGSKGAFQPNPSNIFVANMPGTINTVTLSLNGYFTANTGATFETAALIEGPTGAALDFFSNTGNSSTGLGGTTSPIGTLTFSDSASSVLPSSGNNASGSYRPTAYQGSSPTDTFTSSASGFYNIPGSFAYAEPHGASTFASTFGNSNPNGTWSLFFNAANVLPAEGAQNGWCLNFTQNPVTVTVDESHTGTGTGGDFVQGESGAQITTVVTNSGSGSTGDPVGSNPLTVVDTLNSALTYQSFSGTGWSCSASGQTVTCTNDSPVASGSSYPALTLNVNVSSSAPSSIGNTASVSGAGVATNSGNDTVQIQSPTSLAISKSHSGQFTQGSTGTWILTVSNTASAGSTSGTVTVTDTLPANYTLNNYTSTSSLWTCSGTSTVACTAIPGIAAGGNSTITLSVNIPANSPASVSNTASAYGGGDPVHTNPGTAATSNTDTVSVVGTTTTTAANQTTTFSSSSQNVTLSATVTSTAGTVNAGTVTFTVLNGATPVGTAATSGTVTSGSASVNYTLPAGTPSGTYTIQAVYNGSTDFNGSSDNTHTLTVNGGATTTAGANATAAFSSSNQPVNLTATVTSTAGTVNSGTVTFAVSQGATPIGSATAPATVTGGSASAVYTLPGGTNAGAYTVTASYTGAGGFASSSDNTHTLTVNAAASTTTAANQTATFSASSQSVTLSATVASTAGTVNAGTVTFTVLKGATPVGTATTSGTITGGSASVNYALPAGTSAGTYTIQAVYSSSTNFNGSSDSTHSLTINGGATTTAASNAAATFSSSSQPVNLSAAVTSTAGTVNSGTVTFTVSQGVTQIGSATSPANVVNGSATATYTLPGGTNAGTYTVMASYTGAGGFASSSDNTHTLTVRAAGSTTIAANQTVAFSAGSQLATLSATVTSTAGTVNAGTVTFTLLNGGTPVGTATTSATVASGSASVNYTLPAGTPAGTYTIQAVYNGSVDFNGSSDSTHTLKVTAVPIASISPSSIAFGTLYQGQIVTKTVTITNTGDAAMTISDPRVGIVRGGNSNEFVTVNLCPKSLAAGKSCTMTVTFIAGPFYNPQTATLTITDSAAGSPQQVPLSATVIDPVAQFGAGSLNFGSVRANRDSASKSVIVTSAGGTVLAISSVAITGADKNDYSIASNCAGEAFNPKATCSIAVTFRPTAKGSRTATLLVTDNAQNSPQSIHLLGTGD